MTDHIVGVAWYFPDEWKQLRAAVPDPDVLEATYEEWRAVYADGIEVLKKSGERPLRVDVHIAELLTWCQDRGKRPDAAARAACASDVLRRSYTAGIVLPDA